MVLGCERSTSSLGVLYLETRVEQVTTLYETTDNKPDPFLHNARENCIHECIYSLLHALIDKATVNGRTDTVLWYGIKTWPVCWWWDDEVWLNNVLVKIIMKFTAFPKAWLWCACVIILQIVLNWPLDCCCLKPLPNGSNICQHMTRIVPTMMATPASIMLWRIQHWQSCIGVRPDVDIIMAVEYHLEEYYVHLLVLKWGIK